MEPKVVGKRVKKLIEDYNIDKQFLATNLNISLKELEEKLEGKQEFFVSDVIIITELFNLDINTVAQIFFGTNMGNKKEGLEKKKKQA